MLFFHILVRMRNFLFILNGEAVVTLNLHHWQRLGGHQSAAVE